MFGRKKKQQKKEEHRQAVRKGLLFWLPGGSSRIDVYLDYCVVRCLGKTKLPEKERVIPFTDVKAGQFYSDALVWAYENGIAKGVTDQRFAPHASVTREQMVVFFARFAQLNGQTVEAKGDLSNYHDAGAISNYAKESMAWAVETGLIQGITSTTLSPKTTSTRAQIAEVLLRYCTTFGSSQTSSTSIPLIG